MAPAKPALEAERSCSRGHGNHFDSLLAARAPVGQAARANARADGPGEPASPVAHALSRGGQRPADRVEGLLEGALGPADMSGRAALDPPELHTGGAHAARRLRAKRLELVLELRQARLELFEACLRGARRCATSGTLGHVSSRVTQVERALSQKYLKAGPGSKHSMAKQIGPAPGILRPGHERRPYSLPRSGIRLH